MPAGDYPRGQGLEFPEGLIPHVPPLPTVGVNLGLALGSVFHAHFVVGDRPLAGIGDALLALAENPFGLSVR